MASKQIAKSFSLDTFSVGSDDGHCPFKISIISEGGGSIIFNVAFGTFNNVVPTNVSSEFSVSNSGITYIAVRGRSDIAESGLSAEAHNLFQTCEIYMSSSVLQNSIEPRVPMYCYYIIGLFVNGTLYNMANCSNAYATPRLVSFTTSNFGDPNVGQKLYWTWDIKT